MKRRARRRQDALRPNDLWIRMHRSIDLETEKQKQEKHFCRFYYVYYVMHYIN